MVSLSIRPVDEFDLPPGTSLEPAAKVEGLTTKDVQNAIGRGEFPSAEKSVKEEAVVGEISGTILPPSTNDRVAKLNDPLTLAAIQDFVAGKTNLPPTIPGLTDNFLEQISQPAAVQAVSEEPALEQPQANTQGQPVQAPAPSDPAMLQVLQLLAQGQAQQAALLQQVAAPKAPEVPEHVRMKEAGYNPANPDHVDIFRANERAVKLEASVQRLERQLEDQRSSQFQAQAEQFFGQWANDTIAQNAPGVKLPPATLSHIAKVASALAPSIGQEAAMLQALAPFEPLVQQLKAQAKPAAKPAAKPVAPKFEPKPGVPAQLQALQQSPALKGMTPAQLQQVLTALTASASSGAGGGRQEQMTLAKARSAYFRS